MDLSRDLLIHSGEGIGSGTFERYYGSRSRPAILARLTRERCHGDRWARLWIAEPETEDETGHPVYAEIEWTGIGWEGRDRRAIPAYAIKADPLKDAARTMARVTSPARAVVARVNGARGGRPRIVSCPPFSRLGVGSPRGAGVGRVGLVRPAVAIR